MVALALLLLALPLGAAAAEWSVLYEENFRGGVSDAAVPWTRDRRGGPGELGDDGAFFRKNGGRDFARALDSFQTLRKRVRFGQDGWLTAELAARDAGERPSLRGGLLRVPSHHGALLIRSTKPLPSVYRVETEFARVDFGGTRGGSWDYDGKVNGYAKEGEKTAYPWSWGAFPKEWPDIRAANGFYFLAITDYSDPAPHNNVFIHTHRKVVIDTYNVMGRPSWQACRPDTGKLYDSQDRTVNAFFALPGTALQSKAVMETACGTFYGDEDGAPSFVAAAQMRPGESYRFAVERDTWSYTVELSGNFVHGGARTLRHRRPFVKDGRELWHHDQRSYPEHFILGDPHLNFYEGEAVATKVRLLVPARAGGAGASEAPAPTSPRRATSRP